MSTATERSRIPVDELAVQVRPEMVPLGKNFTYFFVTPMAEEDSRQFIEEPVSALPPSLHGVLPKVEIVLVPFLEKGNGKSGDFACFEKPAESRQIFVSRLESKNAITLFFAVKDEDLADYHYTFYNAIASLIAAQEGSEAHEKYYRTLREELAAEVHGEVEDRSWHLKQTLLRRPTNPRKESKPFRAYARQSLEDTLTLYLHGICCDIDVETGPRQMPSRYLRKRLEMLSKIFEPPVGYAVLPEQAKKR
ncbi:MAG: hypothetical protein ACRD8O_14070 [Bryobacteraceae bacterium]